MTRARYVQKLARNLKKKDLVSYMCPSIFGCGPRYDEQTIAFDRIGCRGITCHECWNKEVS